MTRARGTGFTYLGVLAFVALSGVLLAAAGRAWHTHEQREREAELLFIGHEYRKAIRRYYLNTPGTARYPRDLAELLDDRRHLDVRRHLRKLYRDPITGGGWGLVRSADGGIAGVYSQSTARPLKTSNFRLEDKGFEEGASYADWQFVFHPGLSPAPRKPASTVGMLGLQPQ